MINSTRKRFNVFTLFLFSLLFSTGFASAQCPRFFNGTLALSSNPLWVSCSGTSYNLILQSDVTIGPFTVNFGDGSPVASYPGLVPPAFVSHSYSSTIDTFIVTIITGSGCTIIGKVVMEKNVNASIQIPIGGVTATCAPATLQFINSSTNVSKTTRFIWNFGDGSPLEYYDWTNAGKIVNHTYKKNTVSCETKVLLSAENYCSFGNPTLATFYPIQIWDVDTAVVSADRTFLCYPDTTVHFTNQTVKNCLPQGNTNQRYEYWNFGNYWGKGTDSIINWLPFDPPIRIGYTIAYPGIGTYNVMMIDSNLCGRDTAYITVKIVAPPIAAMSGPDTVCAGSVATFNNLSTGGANQYSWNFGAGGGWINTGNGSQSYTYATSGNFIVKLAINVAGGTSSCRDTVQKNIVVLAKPNALFTINNANGCDSVLVAFNNSSSGANIVSYFWTFGNAQTSILKNPPPMLYTTSGTYIIKLVVTNAQGCTHSNSKTVRVYKTPVANFTALNVCVGSLATFVNTSTTVSGQPITSNAWNFGDGGTSTATNPTYTYLLAGTYVVTLKVNTANCTKTIIKNITVQQKPKASFTATPVIGCTPLKVSFTNTSLFGATYSWNFGDGNTSTLTNPTHTFVNTTSSIAYFVVNMTANNAFGCSTNFTDTIEVYPAPTLDFSFNAAPACAPLIVSFNNLSTSAVSYIWDFGDGANSTLTNPTHQYINTTLFMINFNVSLIGTSAKGCKDTITKQVGVFPQPNFGFSLSPDSGCAPLKVTFPSVLGAVLHDWDFGDGGTSTNATPTHTFLNNTTNVKIYTIRLIATNAFGCKDTVFNSVKVFPNPTANFSINKTAGCQPLDVQFQNNSIAATSVFWDFGDGTTSTSPATMLNHVYTHTINVAVNYIVKLVVTSNGGCKDSTTKIVKVFPVIKAKFTSDSVGCSPLPISFINQSTTGSSSFWNFGNGFISASANPSHTFINNGTVDSIYSVTLIATNSSGCQDTAVRLITVHPNPAVSFDVDKVSGCQPFEVIITNTTTGATSYLWDFGDGNTSTTTNALFTHTYSHNSTSPITYTIRLTATSPFGCIKTITKTVTVFPKISAAFTSNTMGCSPLRVKFTNQSSGASTYFWDFGDGFVDAGINPTHNFVNLTSSTIIYNVLLISTSTNGCQDSAITAITVFPSSQSIFTSDVQNGCQPLEVTFTNNSINANTILWNFGDGTTSTSSSTTIKHIYTHNSTTATSYIVTLITNTINGCADTSQQVILVQPKIIALFSSNQTGCTPLTVKFINKSIGALSYFWDFGDGGVDASANPTHVYVNSGSTPITYTVSMIATAISGCSDTATTLITVNPSSLAAFTVDKLGGCQPLSILINNTSSNATIFSWDFGDGITSTSSASTIAHTYTHTSPSSINYTIRLITNNSTGCADTTTQTVLVQPIVTAAFTSINNGCSPLKVTFTNNSTGANSYLWNFGDGNVSVSQNPTHTYNNITLSNQIYTVTLISTAISGCKDTATKIITVYPASVAAFTVDNISGCTPVKVNFTNTSTGATSYFWNFGDGATSSSSASTLSHTFVNIQTTATTYLVSLITISSNGCADTATQNIVVQPKIIAGFTSITNGCAPLKVKFTNSSTGAVSYLWDFGDATTDANVNPSHTFINLTQATQVFTVTLIATASSGCKDTITSQITVYPASQSIFSADKTSGCQPLDVTFSNNSVGAGTSYWNFGDGTTLISTAGTINHSYTHNFTTPVTYTVTLITNTTNGCADTSTQQILVQPKINAVFSSINDGCSPLKVAFTNNSTGANSYLWDFGDGNVNASINPVHTFVNNSLLTQTYNVILISTAASGCSDTMQKIITVYPETKPAFSTDLQTGCQPLLVNFTNTTQNAISYLWDFGDGSTSTSSASTFDHTFVHNSPVPQIFQVKLITISLNGCTDTIKQAITVFPKIEAKFIGTDSGCAPITIGFTNESTGYINSQWDFGDGFIEITNNPSHTFTNFTQTPIVYQVKLIVTSLSGCQDTISKNVTIFPKPDAEFIAAELSGCQPFNAEFTNTSVGANQSRWDFGDGIIVNDTARIIRHMYEHNSVSPVQYNVKLLITNTNGCTDTMNRLVKVNPKLSARFTSDSIGCSPYKVDFNNLSEGTANYLWDFGDGFTDVLKNTKHTFVNNRDSDTTFNVRLISSSVYGCYDTAYKAITVHPSPKIDFLLSGNSGCQPYIVTIRNKTIGATNQTWDFGDGNSIQSTDSIITHSYSHSSLVPINYRITVRVDNLQGCSDTSSKSITVLPVLKAAYSYNKNDCSPVTASFVNSSIGATGFQWNFGDGKNDVVANPVHTFYNNGIADTLFNVRMIAISPFGCIDTTFKSIVVAPSPKAAFKIDGDELMQPNTTAIVTNKSKAGNWTYKWSWGDGTFSTLKDPGTHTYLTYGDFEIVLVQKSQYCADTTKQTLRINPALPVASFKGEASGCKPVIVQFSNTSTYATEFFWEFGDGGTSTQSDPSYVYYRPGKYAVKLTAIGPGGKSEKVQLDSIEVFELPTALFVVNPTIVFLPDKPAVFYNLSTDDVGSTYEWDFGDGNTSFEESPEHYYKKVGSFTITLKVTNAAGCIDTYVLENAVVAESKGEVSVPNAFTPNPSGPSGGLINPNDMSNDIFYPVIIGAEQFHLTVYNRWGELIFESFDQQVGWDGYYRNEMCMQDVYVWKVDGVFVDGRKFAKLGDVTLLR